MQLQDYAVDYGTVTLGCAPPSVILDDTAKPTLQGIKNLQDLCFTVPESERMVFEPVHHHAGGVYLRELTIEAGMVVVGKMHRFEHHAILASGTATVVTDGHRETITGPCAWKSAPGVKRAIYTHTRCTFYTTHATDETDIDAIEAAHIVPEALIDYDGRTEAGPFANELMEVYA